LADQSPSQQTDTVVWVTGASSGIGRELVKQYAGRDNTVVVASARTESALQQLADESNGAVLPLAADVSDPDSMQRASDRLRQLVSRVDICIVNAGTCEYLDVQDLDVESAERVFDINFHGAMRTVRAALPLMGRESRLVGVSSMSTLLPFTRAQAYGASKAAIEYFFRSCEIDLKASGIAVSVVRPGFVDTPLTRRNTFGMPFIIDSQQAASRIVDGVDAGRRSIAFPRRLNWLLMALRYTPWLWHRWLGPRLASPSTNNQ